MPIKPKVVKKIMDNDIEEEVKAVVAPEPEDDYDPDGDYWDDDDPWENPPDPLVPYGEWDEDDGNGWYLDTEDARISRTYRGPFDTDERAFTQVLEEAMTGDANALKALQLVLKYNEDGEYEDYREVVEKLS